MSGRRGLVAAIFSLVLAVLAVGFLPAVSAAQEDDANLTVREVDGRDAESVGVTFLYTGDPGDLETMSLRENGVAQEIALTPMSKTDQRMATVVVIDTSSSMLKDGTLPAVTAAMEDFVGGVRPGDHMAVISFNDTVTVETDFTSDQEQLRTAVEDIAAPSDGKRALYSAVHRAGLLLTDQQRLQGDSDTQANIVLVTDGPDTASENVGTSEVASVLRSSEAALFTIDLTHAGGTDRGPLESWIDKAGGLIVEAPDSASVPTAVDRVERALASQYVASYTSTNTNGTIEVLLTVGSESKKASYVAGSQAAGAGTQYVAAEDSSFGPAWLRGSTGLLLIILLTGLGVGGLVYAAASLATSSDDGLDAMLRPYEEGGMLTDEDDKGLAQTAILQRAVEMTEDFAESQGFLVKVERMLERADLPLRAAEALFFYVAGLLILGLGAIVLLGAVPGIMVLFMLALLPPAALAFMAGRRGKKFVSQLPDTLHLLSGSLRAGYSLMQGVEAVSQEVEEPMGKELRRVITEARLGREVEESLDGVAERMDSPDFAWAVMAIRIQREVGGNLAELLNTVAETMVQRERLRREVAALTAEGKISAIILGGLPVGLGFLMWLINPTYMAPLGNTGLGQGLLAAAIVSALVGFVWMKKTITIEL